MFLVQTTPQSIGLTAHRTGICLETKEAFKTERGRVSNGPAFFLLTYSNAAANLE
jgi:hypothetical protein